MTTHQIANIDGMTMLTKQSSAPSARVRRVARSLHRLMTLSRQSGNAPDMDGTRNAFQRRSARTAPRLPASLRRACAGAQAQTVAACARIAQTGERASARVRCCLFCFYIAASLAGTTRLRTSRGSAPARIGWRRSLPRGSTALGRMLALAHKARCCCASSMVASWV